MKVAEKSAGYKVGAMAPSLRYRWVILGVCWLAYIVAFMQRLSIGPLAPFLQEDLHLTGTEVGLFMSAASFGYLITTIPAGWLADKIGVRKMLLIGELTGGIFIAGMFFTTTFTWGLIFMGLAGLGMGCIMPATTKAIVGWFSLKERATAMGFKQTALNIGGIITAATLPTLALTLGWRYGFAIISITGIIIGIVSFILYKPPLQSGGINTPALVSSRPGRSLREILKAREIWLIGFAGLCMCAVEHSTTAYFVLYSQQVLLLPVVTAGFFLALLMGGGAFGRPISGLISDRLWHGNRKKPYILMNAIACALCVIFAVIQPGSPTWVIIFLCLALGFSGVGWAGLHLTIAGEIAGEELAGTVTGGVAMLSMIGAVVGPPVFGYLADATGAYQTSWLSMAFAAALAVVLLLFVREEKRRI